MPRDNREPGYSTGTKGSSALDRGVLGATRFLIVGVQKKAGPLRGNHIWRVELTAIPDLLERGRKKYCTLLRHHAR